MRAERAENHRSREKKISGVRHERRRDDVRPLLRVTQNTAVSDLA
jgi:hypothetical protein